MEQQKEKKIPATMDEKLQYLSHDFNDTAIRYALYYPARLSAEGMKQAMLSLVKMDEKLHGSFCAEGSPFWIVHEDTPTEDLITILPSVTDVEAAAREAAAAPLRQEAKASIHCTLLLGERESALVLVISHLCADGGAGEYLLKTLCQLYTRWEAGEAPSPEPLRQSGKTLSPLYEEAARPEHLQGEKEEKKEHRHVHVHSEFPFPEKEREGKARIIVRILPPQLLQSAHERGNALNATVNDVFLTAYYRAYAELAGLDEHAPVRIMSMMDLRRRGRETEEGLGNFSIPLPTILYDGIGDRFEETLRQISEQTRAAKQKEEEPEAGTGQSAEKLLGKIPYRLLLFFAGRAYRMMSLGMTNMGKVNPASFQLAGTAPSHGFFAGPMKKKPGMQISALTVGNQAALCIASECGEQDAALLERFLGMIEQEIREFAQQHMNEG